MFTAPEALEAHDLLRMLGEKTYLLERTQRRNKELEAALAATQARVRDLEQTEEAPVDASTTG